MPNLIAKGKSTLVEALYAMGFRKAFVKLNRLLIRRITPRIARILQLFFKIKKGKIVSCSTAGVSNMQFYLLLRELKLYDGWSSIVRYNEFNRYSLMTKLVSLPYHLATAEVILVEDIYRPIKHLKRGKGQIIIQTWHALGAFKKFGRALADNLERLENENKQEIEYSHRYSYILDPGLRFREKYYDSFAPGFEVLEQIFNPRVDLLFDKEYIEMRTKQLYEYYPELQGKRVFLYAPTYRGFSRRRDASHFMNFDVFLDKLPDDVVLVLKRHPSMMKSRYFMPDVRNEHKFMDISEANINDLLQISELLITDYSSVFFEGAILNKPVYFLVKDFDQYADDRGFYFDLRTFVPGPLCKNELELAAEIENDNDNGRSATFVKEYFGEVSVDNSKRLAEFIANYSRSRGSDITLNDSERLDISEVLNMDEIELGLYLTGKTKLASNKRK